MGEAENLGSTKPNHRRIKNKKGLATQSQQGGPAAIGGTGFLIPSLVTSL